MTDTPIIALYYREHDPMKRKMFLDQSIAAGEDEEANAVRKELWELRYGEPSEAVSGTRADGYLASSNCIYCQHPCILTWIIPPSYPQCCRYLHRKPPWG